jgi:hypothetical protein
MLSGANVLGIATNKEAKHLPCASPRVFSSDYYSNLMKMLGRASKTLRVFRNPKGLQLRNFIIVGVLRSYCTPESDRS